MYKSNLTIAVVGMSGVGKTSFINTITNSKYTHQRKYSPTFGIDTYNVKNMKSSITLLDFAGQEVYGIKKKHFTNVDIVLIMGSSISRQSWKNCNMWINKINKIPYYYCCNKIDASNAIRTNYIPRKCFHMSSKTGQGCMGIIEYFTLHYKKYFEKCNKILNIVFPDDISYVVLSYI